MQKSYDIGKITVLSIILIIMFLPIYIMLVTSLKTNEQYYQNFFSLMFPMHLENYSYAMKKILPSVFNSFYITGSTVALTLSISAITAYVFARYSFPGKSILFLSLAATIMIPGVLIMIPEFIVAIKLNLRDTYASMILVPTAGLMVMQIMIIKTFFAGLPNALFEAAEIDGAGHTGLLLRIALPLSRPILATSAIMVAVSSWNDFLWPILIINKESKYPISVILRTFTDNNMGEPVWGQITAGYVVAALPMLIIFRFGMRFFVAGITAGAVKG